MEFPKILAATGSVIRLDQYSIQYNFAAEPNLSFYWKQTSVFGFLTQEESIVPPQRNSLAFLVQLKLFFFTAIRKSTPVKVYRCTVVRVIT
jgi:hypothetical protein